MKQKNTQPLINRLQQLTEGTKIRFILVGISNTLIDFIFFNILLWVFSADLITANIIATTIAMMYSYLMNKQAVFRNKKTHSARQVVLFFAVTITGIWIIQTIIMVQVFGLLEGEFATQGHPWLVWFLQNVAKAVGIAASAAWNYFGYSRLVFRDKPKKS